MNKLAATLFPLLLLAAACAGGTEDASTDHAAVSVAAPKLLCASRRTPVYYASESQVLLSANVAQGGVLANAALTMPSEPNLGVRSETIEAQRTYNPSNPRYRGMQKYSAADAWCGYSVIAPKDLAGMSGRFTVYVQQVCEGGFVSTAELGCKIERGQAEPPTATAETASVELRFSAAGKTAAIDVGYYKAEQFNGNTIVVASPRTDLDIEYLASEDSESVPDQGVCYTGDATAAKKIFWTMLSNTDGNGDHWLDEGAQIKIGAAGTLELAWSVTGEGGSSPRSMSVPVCR